MVFARGCATHRAPDTLATGEAGDVLTGIIDMGVIAQYCAIAAGDGHAGEGARHAAGVGARWSSMTRPAWGCGCTGWCRGGG